MCLLLFRYGLHADYRLVLAANRDEYYHRPARPLLFWDDAHHILAGRDLAGSGTWLGITLNGRIAAITNYRDPATYMAHAPSRGLLVRKFLEETESPPDYLERVKSVGHRYNGFNLLVGDVSGLYYYSNRRLDIQIIKPGLYGISNHLLDTPWPKVTRGKKNLETLFRMKRPITPDDIFNILADRFYPPKHRLPHTGVGRKWERILSPIFITSRTYGTRSSSVIIVKKTGRISFAERTFGPGCKSDFPHRSRIFSLMMS